MKTELQSMSKIFIDRIFRIPDYQRGYAWTKKQLKEFWNDLIQLRDNHNHYVGVLTLEDVPTDVYSNWPEDIWIIKSKNYTPYYVVDGQQRLTTSIILIQAITESLKEKEELNYTSKEEIRKRFIFESKDGGISRSYLFGYEKDNPSYEYLKTNIFGETSDSSNTPQETIYTINLENAKKFFNDELEKLTKKEIEVIYKKITQNFLFNIYAISEDVDTYVAFETMNNRGKPLSHLELLKNRLIYLSTKIEDSDEEKTRLRSAINEAWKSVYHFLGKNKLKPLDDDLFLVNHFFIYFANNTKNENHYHFPGITIDGIRYHYEEYLLELYFSPKAIQSNDTGTQSLKIAEIYSYVQSLKISVETWYYILNPSESTFGPETKYWLDKINRLDMPPVAPFILLYFQNEKKESKRVSMLKLLEEVLFFISLFNKYGWESKTVLFRDTLQEITTKKISCEAGLNKIREAHNVRLKDSHIANRIIEEFRESGFYKWEKIRYFFFEYELSLKEKTKTDRDKLDWNTLNESRNDYYTIEHIYPQNSKKEHWTLKFRPFQTKERHALKQSLGNLLPLSKPKNCSLQDKSFLEKKGITGSNVGFRYGSYSEIEVAEYETWTAHEILERGLKLLDYMEKRWNINIGGRKEKIYMLGLRTVAEKLIKNQSKTVTQNIKPPNL